MGELSSTGRRDDYASALQVQFAAFARDNAQASCWLLLDPAVYDPAGCLGMNSMLRDSARPVAWQHPNLLPEHRPYLVELALERFDADELLKASLQLALDNWQPQSLIEGGGHSVCGWLFGTGSTALLAQHLGALAVQPSAAEGSASRTLLRFWDPSVLAQLAASLTAPQQSALLGPVQAWHFIDRDCRLRTVRGDGKPAACTGGHLHLDAGQWLAIDNIGPLNAALIEGGQELGPLPAGLVEQVQAGLMRARRAGVHDARDLKAFARTGLTIHPRFDQHPQVIGAMRQLTSKKFFQAAVSELTQQDWQAIRHDCLATDHASHSPDPL